MNRHELARDRVALVAAAAVSITQIEQSLLAARAAERFHDAVDGAMRAAIDAASPGFPANVRPRGSDRGRCALHLGRANAARRRAAQTKHRLIRSSECRDPRLARLLLHRCHQPSRFTERDRPP
jgi:hypothetical protein